jgi:hypothetical protein
MSSPMTPDERVFLDHLGSGAFRSGEARGRWRMISVEWPKAVVTVRAAPRGGAPDEYAFQLDLAGYPNQAPTCAPWDVDKAAPLSPPDWPAGTPDSRVAHAFNPGWRKDAVYLPCDRQALKGHDQWRTQHPSLLWSPRKDITFFLGILHDLLDSASYTGRRGT